MVHDMMLASRLFNATGRSLTRSLFSSSCSFHSAMKRQSKAEKKAKEKDAKSAEATEAQVL